MMNSVFCFFFFFVKQKTAYDIMPSLVGSEMCIRDRSNGNCGLCVVEVGADAPRDVKACLTPVQAGMVITTHSPRLEAYRKVRLEQLLCDHNADCVAPCVETCPANIDIQTYLSHVADGNYEAAVRVIKDRNPCLLYTSDA